MPRALSLVACVLVLTLSGCGGSEEEVLCSDVSTQFYGAGCYLQTTTGGVLTEGEFYSLCTQLKVEAAAQGGSCPARLSTLLACMSSVTGSAGCETCNDELGRLKACP